MSENTIIVDNTQALHRAVEQLTQSGTLLTVLNIAVIAVGLALSVLIIVDWSRKHWGNVLPALLIVVGVTTILVGFLLLAIVGTPVGLQNYAVAGDEATQTVLQEAKQISAPLAALSVLALSSGAMYATLGVVAIWKNRRQERLERGMEMEVAAV